VFTQHQDGWQNLTGRNVIPFFATGIAAVSDHIFRASGADGVTGGSTRRRWRRTSGEHGAMCVPADYFREARA